MQSERAESRDRRFRAAQRIPVAVDGLDLGNAIADLVEVEKELSFALTTSADPAVQFVQIEHRFCRHVGQRPTDILSGVFGAAQKRLAGFREVEVGELQIAERSEEHTSELQSLMRISYAVFC